MMKIFTKKRIVIFLIVLVGCLLIAFPFGERAQYKRDLKEYRAKLVQLEIQSADDGSAPVILNFPPQPLGPPYPSTWTELLEWVGPIENYGATNDEITEFKSMLHQRNGGLTKAVAVLTPPDQRDRQGYKILSKPELATLEEFVQLNREILDRLHQIRGANGIYFDPHFTPDEFKTSTRKEMRRWHSRSLGRLPTLLHLEAVYLSETGRVDEALNSVLTSLRLSEHFMASWDFYGLGFSSRSPKSTLEVLLERNRLSPEQLKQMIDWALHMESQFDYTNALVGLQITMQQAGVLANDRIKPFRNEPELKADASFTEKIRFSRKKSDTTR